MKRTTLGLFVAGALAIVGCENKSPPGGPGAVKPDGTTPRVTTPENSFKIGVPSVDLKQGESKTVEVSITRGTNFDQDVKLEVANPPQGVTVKFDDATLKAGAKEVHMTVNAAADAALGEHKVTLSATPARSGPATSVEFKVEVKKP
jgi:uncharacterized membrane protein